MIKHILFILNYIGALTIFMLSFMILKIILKYSIPIHIYLEYILYFGTGILLYYPTSYLINKNTNE